MLLIALEKNPYDYYTILRFVVFFVALGGVKISFDKERKHWIWILGFIALLFNPIFPIKLSRETWAPIDVITAIVLTTSSLCIRGKLKKDSKKIPKKNPPQNKSTEELWW